MNAPRTYKRDTLTLHSVAPDLIPQDAPADVWNSGINVVFRNNESTRVSGDTPTLPNAALNARTAVLVVVGGVGYWVYATNSGVFVHDGVTEFDISPVGGWNGDDTATFTSCVLNGLAFLNASNRDPVYWDGNVSNPCQPLPDWPANGRCLALRAHKNFLFAIGMLSEGGGGGQRVRWSDAAEAGTVPQSWEPGPDNLAGFVDLAPLSSPALEGATLRDSFMIYKNESVWSFDFVGGNAVFRARKLFAEHGIVNTNALTGGIDDVHLFVSAEGDVMLTDGVRVQSVLDGRAARSFYADFTQNKDSLFAAATLAREKLGIIAYPEAGAIRANTALLFDFSSGDIGFRNMPDILCMAPGAKLIDVGEQNAWDGDDEAWVDDTTTWTQEVVGVTLDDVIVGGAFGFAIISDRGSNDFITGPISARLDKSGIAFGNPQARKMVSRIWPKLTGRTGDKLTLRIGGQDVTGGPITLAPAKTFTIGQSNSIDVFVQGRFISIEVTSQGGAPWRMSSIDVEYREVGGF